MPISAVVAEPQPSPTTTSVVIPQAAPCWVFKALRGRRRLSTYAVIDSKLDHSITQTTQAIVILNNLGFFLMSHAPPIGTKGGLLLAWRHGVDLIFFFFYYC